LLEIFKYNEREIIFKNMRPRKWEKEWKDLEEFIEELEKIEKLDKLDGSIRAIALADEALLDYYTSKIDNRFWPPFPPGSNYGKLEKWLEEKLECFLRREMAGLFEILGDDVLEKFKSLRRRVAWLFVKGLITPKTFEKILCSKTELNPGIVREIPSYLQPGSTLFLLELYFLLLKSRGDLQPVGVLEIILDTLAQQDEKIRDLLEEPALTVRLWEHQREALRAWTDAGCNGVIQMATATGKTLVGLAAALELYRRFGRLDVLVVSHSRVLLDQWRREAIDKLGLRASPYDSYEKPLYYERDGKMFRMRFETVQTVVKRPKNFSTDLLIVDEVHHTAGPVFSEVWRVPARWRMGLSATVEGERERVLDELGARTVYTLTLGDALRRGIIPEFRLLIHTTYMDEGEGAEFEELTRQISEMFRKIEGDVRTIQELSDGKMTELRTIADFLELLERARFHRKDVPEEWRRLQSLILKRRWVIHRSTARIGRLLELADAISGGGRKKCLVFVMDVDTCRKVSEKLRESLGGRVPVFEVHSGMKPTEISAALEKFRHSAAGFLVSPKILDEGVDIPDAEVGVNLASSRTRLQLVQRIGRILRGRPGKSPEFHHFVAIPRRQSYLEGEDGLRCLEDLIWILDIALRMGLKVQENPEQGTPELVRKAEEEFARTVESGAPVKTERFGTIRIDGILDSMMAAGREPVEELVRLLEERKGRELQDLEWYEILRRAYREKLDIIRGHWWLLIACRRDPEILARLIRSRLK
jgi:superfamily II DNA or RNA helicase